MMCFSVPNAVAWGAAWTWAALLSCAIGRTVVLHPQLQQCITWTFDKKFKQCADCLILQCQNTPGCGNPGISQQCHRTETNFFVCLCKWNCKKSDYGWTDGHHLLSRPAGKHHSDFDSSEQLPNDFACSNHGGDKSANFFAPGDWGRVKWSLHSSLRDDNAALLFRWMLEWVGPQVEEKMFVCYWVQGMQCCTVRNFHKVA